MRIRSVLVLVAILAVAAAAVLPSLTSAQEKAKEPAKEAAKEATATPKYVGVAGCKSCHTGPAKGAIFETWTASKHAKSFEALGEANQKNEVCLKCHTTGFGQALAPGKTAADMQNVGCEACHGPGSEYKALPVMKSREEALKKGLVIPTEKLCLTCHAGEFPKDHPTVPKFDYAQSLVKIEHHSKPVEKK